MLTKAEMKRSTPKQRIAINRIQDAGFNITFIRRIRPRTNSGLLNFLELEIDSLLPQRITINEFGNVGRALDYADRWVPGEFDCPGFGQYGWLLTQ